MNRNEERLTPKHVSHCGMLRTVKILLVARTINRMPVALPRSMEFLWHLLKKYPTSLQCLHYFFV